MNRIFLTWFLLLFSWPSMVLADGGFKQRNVLTPAEIPRQLAVMSHTAGLETLTIWNTVKAESQELAWVLPLPAVPDRIQPGQAAALQMFQMLCAPTVRKPLSKSPEQWAAILMLLLPLPAAIILMLSRRSMTSRLPWFMGMTLLWGAALFVIGYLGGFNRIMSGSPQFKSAVSVEAEVQAGVYDVKVIRGDSVEAVNEWLNGNGFTAFDGDQLLAVEAYVKEGWVFLCSRISPEKAGTVPAHPLTVRFAVEKPVYPMRLTKGAGKVPVDLYVLGTGWFADPSGRLKQEATVDRPSRSGPWKSAHGSLGRQIRDLMETRAAVASGERRSGDNASRVPEGMDLLLDSFLKTGSHITHLSGVFGQESDWSDINFVSSDRMPERQFVTRSVLVREVLRFSILLSGLVGVVFAVAARLRTERGRRPHPGWFSSWVAVTILVFTSSTAWHSRNVIIVPEERVARLGSAGVASADVLFDEWLAAAVAAEKLDGPAEK